MHRYPLIAVLDPEAARAVRQIQLELEEVSGSHACLREWQPHISVGSEAWVKDNEVDAYADRLREATKGIRSMEVVINGFNYIDFWIGGMLKGHTRYVIFLGVHATPQIQRLAEAVETVTAKEKLFYKMHWPYVPHVTLAYKDLTGDGYRKAKQLLSFRQFVCSARLDHFALMKQDDQGMFQEHRRIDLE